LAENKAKKALEETKKSIEAAKKKDKEEEF
jgi:hypothetical protein